jgi:hypothetical protein
MYPSRPPVFPTPTAGRTLKVRAPKGFLRHPVTGRASSDLISRPPQVPSEDWRFQ